MSKFVKSILVIVPAIVIYAYLANRLNFTQDDAYISYRYIANFLNGDGLVYNIGERVEGYTNFGWVIYLVFWGALGAGYIAISKITGLVLGAGVIVVAYHLARLTFSSEDRPLIWLVTLLVAVNQSLAYWSPAGLETAAFAFFASLSLYLYLKRHPLLVLSLVLSVLLRPEGALVAGLLVIIEAVTQRRVPKFSLGCVLMAAVALAPMVLFKIFYYGSLLPNPFYAKAAFSPDKVIDGLKYAGQFFGHYGFYGVPMLLPLVFYRELSKAGRAMWLFTVMFIAYVILVGGDVLKVHRFFLPVFGTMAVLTAISLKLLLVRFSALTRYMIVFLVGVPLLAGTYLWPRDHVEGYNAAEKSFLEKMSFMAGNLKRVDSSDFAVALPTIGIFGYELVGHRIIDLVGLTDSTIARHPQSPIPGIMSTWKEQRYNSGYVLSEAPDYILFSTGIKPSAPAEKALFLYDQFLQGYRRVGFAQETGPGAQVMIRFIYKRWQDVQGDPVPMYPVEFADCYKRGLEYHVAGRPREAIEWFNRAIAVGPDPAHVEILFDLAFSHLTINNADYGLNLMDSVIARDSSVFMAHAVLYKQRMVAGETEKAAAHRRWMEKMVPWLMPRLEAETEELLRQVGRRSGTP